MTEVESKLLEIYEILSQEIYNSSWYFSIVQELIIKFNRNEIIEGKRLLGFSYYACLRETILSLCRVYFEDKDSITFHYLKNHLVYNRKFLGSLGEKNITTIVEEIDHVVEKHAPLLKKLKPLRDKTLSHIDKKHINDPKVIVPESIDFDEIIVCIADFSELMIRISDMDSRFYYPNINPRQIIQQEVENLLGSETIQ